MTPAPPRTPRAWYNPTLRTLVLVTLPLLSLIGAYGTWGLGRRNGLFAALLGVAAQGELPPAYTGIEVIDREMLILVTFFAPALDSENGHILRFVVLGAGQFGAAWTLIQLETLRQGNSGKIFTSLIALVGISIQTLSYTVTVPVYLMLHVLTSTVAGPGHQTHSHGGLLVPSVDLKILPVSIALGYVLPTVLMGLPPTMVSPDMHMLCIALWQPFPIWTLAIHWALRPFASIFIKGNSGSEAPAALGKAYLDSVQHVYRFALGLCMLTHLPVLTMSLLPPSSIASVAPQIAPAFEYSFTEIFVPYLTSREQIPSMAAGVLNFLQWDLYIGSVAVLVWAVFLHQTTERIFVNSSTSKSKPKELVRREGSENSAPRSPVWKVLTWLLLSGPVGAAVVLLWERDDVVKEKVKGGI